MGFRRKGRECALQILFQFDFQSGEETRLIRQYWENNPCPAKARVFAEQLVQGTLEHLKEIDDLICKYALHWKPERFFGIDRNIIRIASYEILYRGDIPVRVTIDEALEIAKKFSTEDSAKFINGILDKIAKYQLNGSNTLEIEE
jgi:N utilization substance protein B